jgi:dihydropteroate synthase
MFTLNCNGRLLVIEKPVLMGIINATPDSFFSGSRQESPGTILKRAELMLAQGATILDIGGQSTRPGSEKIGVEEELKRVIPGIAGIKDHFPEAFISVDTYYAKVAREAVAAGACLINDISAGSIDPEMWETVAGLGVPYILMHMQGNPQTMQDAPSYQNVTREVFDFFLLKIEMLKKAGVRDIILDPGFGFGKTIQHNFELLRHLGLFKPIRYPLMIGLSRKSTIYKTLGITADEALNGTTVLNTIGLMNGANILRVHDVKEAAEAVQLVQACINPG